VLGGTAAFVLIGAVTGGAGVAAMRLPGSRPRFVNAEATDVTGSGPARALRTALGIVGRTKAAREPVLVRKVPHDEGAHGAFSMNEPGKVLPAPNRSDAGGDGSGSKGSAPTQRGDHGGIAGRPILVSVSPDGRSVLLFGLTHPQGRAPVPHLYLGRFDGSTVTHLRRVEVPAGALEGPMGWIGGNAFLLAPGRGEALIVRTDGSRLSIRAVGIPDPCRHVGAPCVQDGPGLLGTNLDGSLLLWRLAALRPGPTVKPLLVLYYATWLNGTHAVRLTGPAARFGPPVASR
jgi:hypothetical protein